MNLWESFLFGLAFECYFKEKGNTIFYKGRPQWSFYIGFLLKFIYIGLTFLAIILSLSFACYVLAGNFFQNPFTLDFKMLMSLFYLGLIPYSLYWFLIKGLPRYASKLKAQLAAYHFYRSQQIEGLEQYRVENSYFTTKRRRRFVSYNYVFSIRMGSQKRNTKFQLVVQNKSFVKKFRCVKKGDVLTLLYNQEGKPVFLLPPEKKQKS